jgi:hypothetical protein
VFIIIKKIDPTITIEDLENFVSPVIKAEFSTKHGALKSIQIFELVDKKGVSTEQHALFRVGPDSIVTPLIKCLTHLALHNIHYPIDQYFVRHWHNDRRSNKIHRQTHIHNKRKDERRRLGLKKEVVAEKVLVAHHE